MSKLYLHDIPFDTFLKYYTSGDLNTDTITSNSRYTPVTQDYTVTTYYRFKYKIDNIDYAVDTVYEPDIMPTKIIKKMFGHEYDSDGISLVPELNSLMYTVIIGMNDSNIDTVLSKYYDKTNHKFKIGSTTLDTIYASETANTGKFTSSSALTVYYIPTNDDIARYMNYMSLYPYYANIKGTIYYAIKYENNNFYIYTNEYTSTKIKILEKYINATISTTLNKDEYGSYYEVYEDNNIIGKIYKLNKYTIMQHPSGDNTKIIFKDTYTGNNINFAIDDAPLSPIVRYHKLMRDQKEKSINVSYHEDNESLILPITNYMYLVRYNDRFNIEYAPTFYRYIYYPYANGMTSTDNITSEEGKLFTRVPKYTATTGTFYSSDTWYNELMDVINGSIHLYKDKCELVKYNNVNINDDNNNVVSTTIKTSIIDSTDIYKYYGTKSHKRILFSTNDAKVIHKYKSTFYPQNTIKDSDDYPYKSEGYYSKLTVTTGATTITSEISEEVYLSLDSVFKDSDYGFVVIDRVGLNDDDKIKHGYIDVNTIVDSGEYYGYDASSLTINNNKYYVTFKPLKEILTTIVTALNTGYTDEPYYTKCTNNNLVKYWRNRFVNNIGKLDNITTNTINGLKTVFNSAHDTSEEYKTFYNYVESTVTDSNDISTLNNSIQKESEKSIDTILKSTLNSSNNNFLITGVTNKYSIKAYVDSLFKSIVFLNEHNPEDNTGGLYIDKNTNKTYNGFVDYTDDMVEFIQRSSIIKMHKTNSITLANEGDYKADDIATVQKEVANNNFLDRLFNYNKYPINAEEIYDILDYNDYKNKYLSKTSNTTYSNYNVDIITESTKDLCYDLNDMKEKCISLFTEYIYTEFKNDDKLDFYRNSYDSYIEKVEDDTNQFIFTNNNNYGIKYVFNNTGADTNTFFDLLDLRS